jgi:ethanolamine utilization protein EutQ (cupin superfamily)
MPEIRIDEPVGHTLQDLCEQVHGLTAELRGVKSQSENYRKLYEQSDYELRTAKEQIKSLLGQAVSAELKNDVGAKVPSVTIRVIIEDDDGMKIGEGITNYPVDYPAEFRIGQAKSHSVKG